MAAPMPTPAPHRQLNVVKISLVLGTSGSESTSGDDNRVLFDLTMDDEQVALLETTVNEIGLPLSLSQARSIQSTESVYRVPDYITAALSHALEQTDEPLWLSFPAPSGYLPVVPWESLLQERLKVPVLRLSYTQVQPVVSLQSLDIVVCYSFPAAKVRSQLLRPSQVINYYFDHIPENFREYTTFHVFADTEFKGVLNDVQKRHPEHKIKVYDPALAARYQVPDQDPNPSGSTTDLESPWLLWIRDSLGTCSADLVHFFCHGFLGREDGFLCFSQSPLRNDDESFSRFVASRQICTFLDQVGAWSVAFSSQPGNYSVSGLRFLQDQMARIRPGPVLFHDMQVDPDAVFLNQAYQYAYAIEEAFAVKSGAISLYCHPAWALPLDLSESEPERLVSELTLKGRLANVFEGAENTPSWLASGQRALERSVAQLLSTAPENPGEILNSGAADALKFTAELLEKHARKMGLGEKS